MEVSVGRYTNFLKLMSVPLPIRIMLGFFFLRFRSMSDNCKVDIVMRDGDEIELGNIAGG